jgi:hypothetical protein
MWARSVCINQSLELGSILPMLDYAQANGFSVIVLNPNMSYDPLTKAPIKCSATMSKHCQTVWSSYIAGKACPAKSLAVIAHSAGGRCVADLIERNTKEFFERVEALVFTDAYYHSLFKLACLSDNHI